MGTKSTIIKNYRNKETLRLVELQEVADMIQKGEYQEQVSEFRSMYPLMTYTTRSKDGTLLRFRPDRKSTRLTPVTT